MIRTRRVDCSDPGITRVRRGRGFAYADPGGERIDDEPTLDRIRALAIPPAWRDVWICLDPHGHIQATGIDAAGRKQYRYHDAWRARRDAAKFEAMIGFAHALPRLRRRVAADLHGDDGLGRARVLACALRLLDVAFFRIGSEDYAEENGSYGLTTLRKEHVRIERGDGAVVFDFPSKSGQRRVQRVRDADVVDVIAALRRRRGGGPELLAWRERRRWVDVKADDVNDLIKQAAGGDFSAKDFRTWNATALMAVALAARAGDVTSRTSRRRVVAAAVREVAGYLGNTPAVCRASYVDPRVIDCFMAGTTIPAGLRSPERVRREVLALIA